MPMDAPGIEIRPLRTIAGSTEFAELFFDDCPRAGRQSAGRRERRLARDDGHPQLRARHGVRGRRCSSRWSCCAGLRDDGAATGEWDEAEMRRRVGPSRRRARRLVGAGAAQRLAGGAYGGARHRGRASSSWRCRSSASASASSGWTCSVPTGWSGTRSSGPWDVSGAARRRHRPDRATPSSCTRGCTASRARSQRGPRRSSETSSPSGSSASPRVRPDGLRAVRRSSGAGRRDAPAVRGTFPSGTGPRRRGARAS